MRNMPQIPEVQKSTRMTTTFSGYNHTEVINDGEMFDMSNLSGDLYPVLSVRKPRGISSWDVSGQDPVPLTGIHGRDQLVYIRGTEVFYNMYPVITAQDNLISAAEGMLPKKIVSMGAYVCIWPDKVYFNTIDPTDKGSMNRMNTIAGGTLKATMCRGDGTDYDMTLIVPSVTPPVSPQNGDFWLDESGEYDVLRQYSVGTLEWVEVPSTYVKIEGTGIGTGLQEYDCVTISGITTPDPEPGQQEDTRLKQQAEELNGSKIIYATGENYIVIAGLLSQAFQTGGFKAQDVGVNREVPDLDFICESNNRLWGCKYGLENGVVVNEIRASKLGDFRNWSCFMGLSSDSYTASIGTDGQWTGAISQRGYPVFFKENAIHRISGTTPSSFAIQTTVARGVQPGSWRSLAVVNGNIYYKSSDGVMLYDGNMPVNVSEKLGGTLYYDARAGALKNKYYISMQDAEDSWHLFTYDTQRGIWFREDNLHALAFGAAGDELYAIDEDNNTLVSFTGSVGTVEDSLEWMAQFGISGVEFRPGNYGMQRSDIPGYHYMSRFDIRMYLEAQKEARLYIMYDESGKWIYQGVVYGKPMKSFIIPVIPRRCDHLRFKLEGNGDMRIYSITRNVEVGSDA